MISKKVNASRGFTLIELVAVIAILVVLAGLVIPKVDSLRYKAGKGASASNAMAVARGLLQYYVEHNRYPAAGWDSLLNTGGATLWTPTASTTNGLDYHLTGVNALLTCIADPLLQVGTIASCAEAQSLVDKGIVSINGLNALYPGENLSTGFAPGDAYIVDSAAASVVIPIDNGAAFAQVIPYTGGSAAVKNVWKAAFPGATDAQLTAFDTAGKLLAVGVGPSSETIGDTLFNVPADPTVDANMVYNRYIAVYYFGAGFKASLRTVLGADGSTFSDNVTAFEAYTTQQ